MTPIEMTSREDHRSPVGHGYVVHTFSCGVAKATLYSFPNDHYHLHVTAPGYSESHSEVRPDELNAIKWAEWEVHDANERAS